MNWELISAFLSIILTVSLWFLGKKFKYPGKMVLLTESCIGLFDSLVTRFPSISINFNNNPVSNKIFYIKSYLANIGTKDITPEMVHEPLKLKAPRGSRWLSVNISSDSTGTSSAIPDETDRNYIVFDLGLFRRKEFIKFEALVEIEKGESCSEMNFGSKDLLQALSFSHRISDTDDIEITEFQKAHKSKTELFKEFILAYLFLISLLLLGSYFLFNKYLKQDLNKPTSTNYLIPMEEGKIFEGKEIKIKKDLIIVESSDGEPDLKLTLKQFAEQFPEWKEKKVFPSKYGKYFLLAFSVIFIILSVKLIYEMLTSISDLWILSGMFNNKNRT